MIVLKTIRTFCKFHQLQTARCFSAKGWQNRCSDKTATSGQPGTKTKLAVKCGSPLALCMTPHDAEHR